MKKANSTEEKLVGEMVVSDEQLGRAKGLLKFPVAPEDREQRATLQQYEYDIRSYMSEVENYQRSIHDYQAHIRTKRLEVSKIRKALGEHAISMKDARAMLGEVVKLPWVEKVSIDGGYLHVFTRKDMLKTVFDIRLVGFGRDVSAPEFLEGPVTASMPQYEFRISLANMGNPWANNIHALALRFSNEEDVAHFVDKGIIPRQQISPHWASNGENTFGAWQYLCLGEYEGDLTKASAKGLVPFLNELVLYLQLSGDQHAYRTKPIWALMIGKKEYEEFNGRMANKGETQAIVHARYTRDYKLMRQPNGAREVNLSELAQATQRNTNEVRRMLDAFQNDTWTAITNTNALTGAATILGGNIVPATTADCDCDLRNETDEDSLDVCDCGGTCECHSDEADF